MEGQALSFDNILGEQEIDTLFSDPQEVKEKEGKKEKEEPVKEDSQKQEKEQATTEVTDPNALFEGEEPEPESVGSEKIETKEKEDANPDIDSGASPNQNFYSSIANALAVDGVFPNLTEDEIKKAEDAESFSDLIEAEVNARLDERQQRISKALDNGVPASAVKNYEDTLNYLSSITDTQLSEEGDKGEILRRRIIYQDFLNKGYNPEKAQKFTDRTIDAGTDVEDAKEALQSNREYFTNAYNQVLQDAQAKADAQKAELRKQSEKMKDSLLKDKQLMGDMVIDPSIRQKAYEAISKPVYRDPDTGQYLTAIQKYEREHNADFLKYTGLIYTLTDGFKDFDSFTKGKVKKEVKKGLRALESTLNNTKRDLGGNLKMVTTIQEDPNSYWGKGLSLDLR